MHHQLGPLAFVKQVDNNPEIPMSALSSSRPSRFRRSRFDIGFPRCWERFSIECWVLDRLVLVFGTIEKLLRGPIQL